MTFFQTSASAQQQRKNYASSHGALFACLITLAISLGWSAPSRAQTDNSSAVQPNGQDYAQRATYLRAKRYLATGQKENFNIALSKLEGYAIAPYLQYHDMRRRLSSVSDKEMHAFAKANADLPITRLLQARWLKAIGSRSQWRRYLTQFEKAKLEHLNKDLQCYRLRALYATNRKKSAFAQVPELWISGKSLPKSCDPIFDLWIKADQLTNTMVWQRLSLALGANQRTLARYLVKLLPQEDQAEGQLFYLAHQQPQKFADKIAQASGGTPQNQDRPRTRQILLHAVQRLLRKGETQQAQTLWQARKHWAFTNEQRSQTEVNIALAYANAGEFPDTDATALQGLPEVQATQLHEGLAMAAVKNQNWSAAYHWIDQLDSAQKAKNRWQYWLARALEETQHSSDRSQLMLAALAQRRDYYGFLAAQRLEQPGVLNRSVTERDAVVEAKLQNNPAFVRATELYAVREFIAAAREWRGLLSNSNQPERAAAATLAADIGWPRQAIAAANKAKLHDDTDLRFPLLHMTHYQRQSHATSVPVAMLLAVSRQESAFDERARSHADARGLMQLLPSTAKQVATRANLAKPTNTSLYRPSTNIEIASHYLATLLDRFNGSRPLAIAGYNAGEHRVDRWLADSANMPMDVWIERIPFRETRNYVQNVLAFIQVYNQKLNQPNPLLQTSELFVPLLPQSQPTTSALAQRD